MEGGDSIGDWGDILYLDVGHVIFKNQMSYVAHLRLSKEKIYWKVLVEL